MQLYRRDGARSCWGPLAERTFVPFCIAVIIVIRIGTILATPRTADFPDPRIYQGTGQTVLAGVNPYDFSDQPALREALRARMVFGSQVDVFTQSQESWDYYVSSNLPASTALYALFETLARGSRFGWRLLFVLGDVAIFLGLFALLKAMHGRVENAADQMGVFCLAVINPVLIVAGCAIPEDKQFETALMLFAAMLLLSPAPTTLRRRFGVGLVLSLSILFKLFGVFLVPLWMVRARQAGSQFVLWSLLGGVLPIAISFAAFGHYFVDTMLARGIQNSIGAPLHASPWILLPGVRGNGYLIVKICVISLFGGTLALLFARGRIDLLNFMAGLAVGFACLWLDKGAMNRMNIVIVFAVAALASLSSRLFAYFSASIVVVSALGYGIGVGLLRLHLETLEAALALLFVCAYPIVLIEFAGVGSAGGSPTVGALDDSRV